MRRKLPWSDPAGARDSRPTHADECSNHSLINIPLWQWRLSIASRVGGGQGQVLLSLTLLKGKFYLSRDIFLCEKVHLESQPLRLRGRMGLEPIPWQQCGTWSEQIIIFKNDFHGNNMLFRGAFSNDHSIRKDLHLKNVDKTFGHRFNFVRAQLLGWNRVSSHIILCPFFCLIAAIISP